MTKRRYNRKVVISSDESDDSFTSPVAKGRKKTSELQRRRAKTTATKKAVQASAADSYAPVVATHVTNQVQTANATSAVSSEIDYTVAKVINKRFLNGRVEYLLEWKNWPLNNCSWEPISNLNCKKLIAQYEKREREKFDNPNYVLAPESAVVSFDSVTDGNGALEFAVKFVDGRTLFFPAYFVMRRFPMKFIEYMKANEHLLPKPVVREEAKEHVHKGQVDRNNAGESVKPGHVDNKKPNDHTITPKVNCEKSKKQKSAKDTRRDLPKEHVKSDDKKANESAQLTRDCEKSTEKKPTRQFVRDEAFDRFLDELPDYEDANEHAILRELDIRKSDSPITTAKLDIGKSKEEKPTEKIDREKAIDRLFQQQSDDEDEEEHDLIRQLDTQEPEQYMIPGTMKISSSSTLSQPADEEWYEHVSRTYDNRKADHYATPKKINVENLREEKPIGKICPDVAIEHNLNAQSGNKELDKELDEHVSPPQTDIQKPDIRASSGTTGDVKLGEPKPTGNVRSDMAINHTLGAPEPVEIDHEIHSLLPSTSRRA